MAEVTVQMQQRRDTAANWTSANPVLLSGELGYETNTGKFKIGDGSAAWNSLAYIPAFAISAHPLATADIADDAVTAAKLAHTSVTAGSYTAADITVDAQGRITAAASGTISTAEIADDAVTAAKLADTAVTAGSYTAADITVDAQGRITAAASGTIGTSEIADDAVTGDKLANDITIANDLTVTNDLTVNGATTTINSIKLKGSSDGSVSLDAPADTSPTGTDVSFTLPTADGTAGQVLSTNGSGALGFVNAITEFDQWALTSNKTDAGDITANLSRPTTVNTASQIGTGMTESSGIFTFPNTGKWLIIATAQFDIVSDDSVGLVTNVSADSGSTYTAHARFHDGQVTTTGNERRGHGTSFAFIDVTDASIFRVKFELTSLDTGSSLVGGYPITTQFIFFRLGDT